LAKPTKKDTLIDLGSGDGRIVIAAAQMGVRSIGYEINPFLVKISRKKIQEVGVEKLATIHWKSLWEADFAPATIVTVYQFPHLLNRLQKMIEEKMKHPIRLVSNDYPFTKLKPKKQIDSVYLYKL
jgi:cyclopropane fatty-acyl-phospholipid synthase-like methyltransferase